MSTCLVCRSICAIFVSPRDVRDLECDQDRADSGLLLFEFYKLSMLASPEAGDWFCILRLILDFVYQHKP